jgi:hypothetical protein
MRTAPLLIALLLFASLPACKGGKSGPDCKAAANAYAALLVQQVDRDHAGNEDRRARALSIVPVLKQEMSTQCEKAKWSAETRRCIVEAKMQEDLQRCMPNVPLEGGPAEPPGAPPPGAPPPDEPPPDEPSEP